MVSFVDETAARIGSVGETHGSPLVARFFSGRAQGALAADIDGIPGAVVAVGGRTRIAIEFIILRDRIVGIDAIADPEQLGQLDVVPVDH